MSKGADYLVEAITAKIDYCREEYNLTYGEAIGVLEFIKIKLINEALEGAEIEE